MSDTPTPTPDSAPSQGLTPTPQSSGPVSFTFRMTLPENWARVDQAILGDPAAVEASLDALVQADRLSGAQADAMAEAFAGLAPQVAGLDLPLVAVYAEPGGDGRFGLATLFAGPHAGEFPLDDSAEPIVVNDAPGKLIRGTLTQPFAGRSNVTCFAAQYVLDSPVPPGKLVVTAATPVVDGFDQTTAELRFHEAVGEIIFHPVG